MTESRKRALRTFLQALAGLATAEGLTAVGDALGHSLTTSQTAVLAVVATALIALAQNLLEDSGTLKDRR